MFVCKWYLLFVFCLRILNGLSILNNRLFVMVGSCVGI